MKQLRSSLPPLLLALLALIPAAAAMATKPAREGRIDVRTR